MKLYAVIGMSGEYSDREEHIVCAYVIERLAQEHCAKALEWRQKNPSKDAYDTSGPSNPFDKECKGQNGYYEVTWYVVEVDLRLQLPA